MLEKILTEDNTFASPSPQSIFTNEPLCKSCYHKQSVLVIIVGILSLNKNAVYIPSSKWLRYFLYLCVCECVQFPKNFAWLKQGMNRYSNFRCMLAIESWITNKINLLLQKII
jgi:hypothetical protein